MVPTRTVNCLRQPLHFQTPGRIWRLPSFLPWLTSLYAPFRPQCGQTGPSGHSCDSKNSRAAVSSENSRDSVERLRSASVPVGAAFLPVGELLGLVDRLYLLGIIVSSCCSKCTTIRFA